MEKPISPRSEMGVECMVELCTCFFSAWALLPCRAAHYSFLLQTFILDV
jgi:hypothetical protein